MGHKPRRGFGQVPEGGLTALPPLIDIGTKPLKPSMKVGSWCLSAGLRGAEGARAACCWLMVD